MRKAVGIEVTEGDREVPERWSRVVLMAAGGMTNVAIARELGTHTDKVGRYGTMTHDYKRHGTTSLFAAMEVASGEVIGETYRRHRHQELLRFLRKVEKEVPKAREIHIILDNYSTHKHGKAREWAEGTKRVHFHFVPTSSSWLNLVERLFSTLTRKRIRRGVFHSVPHLESCLKEYVETYNENPRPFVRTKSAAQIPEKVDRARKALAAASA